MEETKPDYYKYIFPDGNVWDVIDIVRAMNLPFTLGLALKYFRVKGDVNKRINDLEKCKVCIDREIKYLKENKNE